MFEEAEKDPTLDDKQFAKLEDALRTELLVEQYRVLKQGERTILVVVAGIDGAGKGSTVNLLNEWLDPRHVSTLAFAEPNAHEAERPAMWRYWNGMPAKGHTGIVFGSWYAPMLAEARRTHPDEQALRSMAAAIVHFESMLAADGVEVVKLWFHLSREAQQERCARMLADPDTAWRVSEADLQVGREFERLRQAGEAVISATHTTAAPWLIIPSADENWRITATARTVLQAFRHPPNVPPLEKLAPIETEDRFAGLDYAASLAKKEYEQRFVRGMARVGRAVRRPGFRERSLVLVFEGDDAAGKGGAIRRLARAMDARQYAIIPIAAPSDEERARPYLWRFWRHVPARGRVAVFDRSWYGRVLVERVEGFAATEDWQRAYGEIQDFEAQLVAHGAILLKFWLSITPAEQLKRFRAREKTPFKSFKITDEDWRNREKAPQYREAASEMLVRTHTPDAPWHVIATDDKRYARVRIMEAVAQALEDGMGPGDAG
jgi:polyphosphate:AMP phosphotransferase